MKVFRTSEVLAGGHYEIGDVVSFSLEDGEEVEAVAVKEEFDAQNNAYMVFMFVDCLKKEYPMNERDTNEGGYEESYLRQKLNTEILERFPAAMRLSLIPFDNGDLLRIPTEYEIFGENEYGEQEPDWVEQFEYTKKRRGRIALAGLNGGLQYYWLQNKRVRSATPFACVNGGGYAAYGYASNSSGVRPLYRIRNYR